MKTAIRTNNNSNRSKNKEGDRIYQKSNSGRRKLCQSYRMVKEEEEEGEGDS